MKPSECKVYLDGTEQKIESFETATNQPLNIFLFLDASPSIEKKFSGITNFSRLLFENLKPGDKLAMFKFDANLKTLNELTNDAEIVNKSLKKYKEDGGGTSIYDALGGFLKKKANKITGRKIVILVTDGVDTVSEKERYETSLELFEKFDIPVYSFYLDTFADALNPPNLPLPLRGLISLPSPNPERRKVEYEIGKLYLTDIAHLTGGRTFNFQDMEKLTKDDVAVVSEIIRPQYCATFTIPAGKIKERSAIRVRISRPRLKISARSGFRYLKGD